MAIHQSKSDICTRNNGQEEAKSHFLVAEAWVPNCNTDNSRGSTGPPGKPFFPNWCFSFQGLPLKYYHKLGGLKWQKCIHSQFWRLKVWNEDVSRAAPPLGFWREPYLASSSLLAVIPSVVGIPWLTAVSFQSLSLSSHDILPVVPLNSYDIFLFF